MKFSGQTPLIQAAISEEQRRFLNSLWIESIEEALSVCSATEDFQEALEEAGLKVLSESASALQLVTPERLSELQRARQGGGLGCLMEEQILEDFRSMGRLRSAHAKSSGCRLTD